MKLALLAPDVRTLALAQAAAAGTSHHVVAVYQPGEFAAELRKLFPTATFGEAWESLLAGMPVDAVLVGQGSNNDEKAEQLRRLAQEGLPLLITFPPADAMLMYELDMIRSDNRCPLACDLPDRFHPATSQLIALAQAGGPLGEVQQVLVERSLSDVSKQNVLAVLACDVVILRALAGKLSRISAQGPPHQSTNYANLAVSLTNQQNLLVRWSLQPAGGEATNRIAVYGTSGKAELRMPLDGAWRIDKQLGDRRESQEFAPFVAAEPTLEMFAAHIAGAVAVPSWLEAAQAVEVAETVPESLRRSRTIELHFEQRSEQQSFKGVMAMGGCFILLFAFAMLLLSVVIDNLGLPIRDNFWWRIWPVYVFVPIVFFLLLQTLWRVFATPRSTK